jgi:sugar lactone lactonase YvrE
MFPSSTQTYPAVSTDGGTTWKVDGPLFHVDALQGASVVANTGALGPHGAYFWGRGGNVIWMTYDSGAHWWTVAFGAGVDRVSARNGTLEAVALGSQVKRGTAVQRFLYISSDSGETWRLRRELANRRTAS